jgi:hypothetical protein
MYIVFFKKNCPNLTIAPSGHSAWCPHLYQGCQMVYFQTKNPNLCKFWWVLQWMMSVYSMAMRSIFLPFYGHLVYFVVIGYILWSLGIFSPLW